MELIVVDHHPDQETAITRTRNECSALEEEEEEKSSSFPTSHTLPPSCYLLLLLLLLLFLSSSFFFFSRQWNVSAGGRFACESAGACLFWQDFCSGFVRVHVLTTYKKVCLCVWFISSIWKQSSGCGGKKLLASVWKFCLIWHAQVETL